MRIVSAFVFAGVLGLTSAAFADGVVNDCKPNTSGGCACDEEPFHTCESIDMAMPVLRDMSQPRDLRQQPGDEGLDARREERRRRNAARGRGLIVLSGASALMVLAVRRATKR